MMDTSALPGTAPPDLQVTLKKCFVSLSAERPDFVLNARLEVPGGEQNVVVLFGPSGCGKTSLLRCLAGLERPDEGMIRFQGNTWADAACRVFVTPQQRQVGYMAQDYALFPHMTVEDNILYGITHLHADERNNRVSAMLSLLGIDGVRSVRPDRLSGGQRQRVALARALARRPRLLLLDEPLSALDAPTRDLLRRELRLLLTGNGAPAVIVTHDLAEALTLGDWVAVMDRGTVLQFGRTLDVFRRPATPEVAALVGVETIEAGHVVSIEQERCEVDVQGVRLVATAAAGEVSGNVFVSIRAEDVILEVGATSQASARNQLPGTVSSLEPDGVRVRVWVDCGFMLMALVTRAASEELNLRPGVPIRALIKAPAVHLIPRELGR